MRPGAHRLAGTLLLLLLGAICTTVGVIAIGSIEQDLLGERIGRLMDGLLVTLLIVSVAFSLGLAMSLVQCVMLQFVNPGIQKAIDLLWSMFRYTPALAQLYLVYFGAGEISADLKDIGLWWVFRDPLSCVLIVFTLNSTAYQVFLLRGAIDAVSRTQWEGAFALGLSYRLAVMKVIIPQALRTAIRPLGNELTKLAKASSIASVIAVYDLLGETKLLYSETFSLGYYAVTCAIYILLVELIRMAVEAISQTLDGGMRNGPRPAGNRPRRQSVPDQNRKRQSDSV